MAEHLTHGQSNHIDNGHGGHCVCSAATDIGQFAHGEGWSCRVRELIRAVSVCSACMSPQGEILGVSFHKFHDPNFPMKLFP
jgi:hypothetical protein